MGLPSTNYDVGAKGFEPPTRLAVAGYLLPVAGTARADPLLPKQGRYRTAPRQSPPYPGRPPRLTFLRPVLPRRRRRSELVPIHRAAAAPGFLTSWLPVPATTPRAAFPLAFGRGGDTECLG